MKKLIFIFPIILAIGCSTTLPHKEVLPAIKHHEKCEQDIRAFKVIQVLDNGLLAFIGRKSQYSWVENDYDQVVLISVQTKGKIYYDDQIIPIKDGQCPIFVGTYTYKTRQKIDKTVAVVEIVNFPVN